SCLVARLISRPELNATSMGDPYNFWYTPEGRILVPCADRMSAPFHKADSSFVQKARTCDIPLAFPLHVWEPFKSRGGVLSNVLLNRTLEVSSSSSSSSSRPTPLATGVPSGWKAIHTVLYITSLSVSLRDA
ncbi:hypothetical protein LB507_002481, partial [Fusarium sp. FIESC RH6]